MPLIGFNALTYGDDGDKGTAFEGQYGDGGAADVLNLPPGPDRARRPRARRFFSYHIPGSVLLSDAQ